MTDFPHSRRSFIKTASLAAGAALLSGADYSPDAGRADYTIRIQTNPIEIAPDRIISTTTYNGQFPGPLLRLKEGQPVTIDIFNQTALPSNCTGTDSFFPPMSTARRK